MSVTYGGVEYGVTSTGFVMPTVEVLLGVLVANAQATIDPALDISPGGSIGALFASVAQRLYEGWSIAQMAYEGGDPDLAQGPQLVSLSSITGTIPTPAAPSVVEATMSLNANVTVPAGSLANVAGQPQNTWVLMGTPDPDTGELDPGPVVSTTAGDYPALFYSSSNGPNEAPAGTLNVITAPVSGWTAVINANDAALGNVGYQGTPSDDATLRAKRESELAASGASTIPALQAELDEIPGVISAAVYQNTSSEPDPVTGIPAKSFRCIVWDGVTPAASDDDIAQAIWNQCPSGIQPWASGVWSGTAVDASGISHTILFDRPSQLPLRILATIRTTAAFPSGGSTALIEQIVTAAQSLLSPGSEAVAISLASSCLTASNPSSNVPGVVDVPLFQMATFGSLATANITCAYDEVIVPDTANTAIAIASPTFVGPGW